MVALVSHADTFRPPSQAGNTSEETPADDYAAIYGYCVLGGAFLISAALFIISGLGYGGILPINALGNGLLVGSGAIVFILFSICCCTVLDEIRKSACAPKESNL